MERLGNDLQVKSSLTSLPLRRLPCDKGQPDVTMKAQKGTAEPSGPITETFCKNHWRNARTGGGGTRTRTSEFEGRCATDYTTPPQSEPFRQNLPYSART